MSSRALRRDRSASPRVLVLTAGLCLCGVGVPAAFVSQAIAQGSRTAPSQPTTPTTPTTTTPPAASAPASEAEALLTRLRESVKAVRAMSYDAHVEVITPAQPQGQPAGQPATAPETAQIAARRADAGGWMLAATGTSADGATYEVGYDGATARSLRTRDRTVVERSVDKLDDLRSFLSGQGARHSVAWELLEEELFDDLRSVELIPGVDVAGEATQGLLVIPNPATQRITPGQEPSKAGPALRVYVATSDNLPRRIERVRLDAAGAVVDGRALELRNLKANDQAVAGRFVIDVPSGFRVRAADRTADAAGAAPTFPDTVTWASNRDLLRPGASAPAFSLRDMDGKTVSLESLRGKVVLLDFWATWCGPCQASMPMLQSLHRKYKDKPVVILGMNAEGGQGGDPVAFKKDNGFTYPSLLNADPILSRYRAAGLPTFYLITPEGRIAWGGVGLPGPPGNPRPSREDRVKYMEEQLTIMIDTLLPKPTP